MTYFLKNGISVGNVVHTADILNVDLNAAAGCFGNTKEIEQISNPIGSRGVDLLPAANPLNNRKGVLTGIGSVGVLY